MNISKLFRRFRQKVMLESVLKALLFALMAGGAAVFTVSLVYHILLQKTPIIMTVIIGGSVFAVSFFIMLILRYPTDKRVARRIDSVGLYERASTMYELKDESTEIALLQRNDAVEKIGTVESSQLKFSFKRREWIACIVSICLAVCISVLPYNIFAFNSSDDVISEEQAEKLRDLLDRMREEVKEAEIRDELKEELNDVIDELEENLEEADSELEQAAQIERAKQKMEDILENALTRNSIGAALQKYELTRKLGEAISKGNTEKVSTALEELETELKQDRTKTGELASDVRNALEESGVESGDSLYDGLDYFSNDLSGLDTADAEFESKLGTIFDNVERSIISALEEQEKIKEELEKLKEELEDAKDEVLGNEKEEESEGPEGEKPEGEESGGEKPEGEISGGEKPEGEMPDGERPEGDITGGGEGEGEGQRTMTEKFYDPISGSVEYGEVFAAYYADYLSGLENGTVSEELIDILEKYYSSLN